MPSTAIGRTFVLRNVRVTPGADVIVGRETRRALKFRQNTAWARPVVGSMRRYDVGTLRLAPAESEGWLAYRGMNISVHSNLRSNNNG